MSNKKEFIINYKLSRGCAECGFKERYAALEFDHLEPNNKNHKLRSGRGWNQLTWLELEEELKLCQVLCSNCHRIKTHFERDHLCRHEEQKEEGFTKRLANSGGRSERTRK